MSAAIALHGRPTSRRIPHVPLIHEPTIFDRLEMARNCLLIARGAATLTGDRVLARREVGRARTELDRILRRLERRTRGPQTRVQRDTALLRELTRALIGELKRVGARLRCMA
jgi:hypothetical protein